jgi:hypothetical protein
MTSLLLKIFDTVLTCDGQIHLPFVTAHPRSMKARDTSRSHSYHSIKTCINFIEMSKICVLKF